MVHATVTAPVTTMEDAIVSRRSVRAFLPTPVPRAEVERVLALGGGGGGDAHRW
jgi:hypothetical protein